MLSDPKSAQADKVVARVAPFDLVSVLIILLKRLNDSSGWPEPAYPAIIDVHDRTLFPIILSNILQADVRLPEFPCIVISKFPMESSSSHPQMNTT